MSNYTIKAATVAASIKDLREPVTVYDTAEKNQRATRDVQTRLAMLAQNLADHFEAQDPSFDREGFLRATGVF